jgi:hypothetical protein
MTQCIKITFFFDAGSRVEIACYHPRDRDKAIVLRRRRGFSLGPAVESVSRMLSGVMSVRAGSLRLMGFPCPWGSGFQAVSLREESDRVFNR